MKALEKDRTRRYGSASDLADDLRRHLNNEPVLAGPAAKAVSDFLRYDVLGQASALGQAAPDVKPDPDITVRTALDRAAARLEGRFAAQPEVEVRIRQTIGQTYAELQLLEQSRQQLTRALDLSRRATGEESPDTLDVLDSLAWLEGASLNGKEAVRRYGEPLAIQTRKSRPETSGRHQADAQRRVEPLRGQAGCRRTGTEERRPAGQRGPAD